MFNLSKSAVAVLATVSISAGILLVGSANANAAGLSNPAPVSPIVLDGEIKPTKVHHRRHRRGPRIGIHFGGGFGHGFGRGWGHGRYVDDCFWKRTRRWSHSRGRYVYRKVRVCY